MRADPIVRGYEKIIGLFLPRISVAFLTSLVKGITILFLESWTLSSLILLPLKYMCLALLIAFSIMYLGYNSLVSCCFIVLNSSLRKSEMPLKF